MILSRVCDWISDNRDRINLCMIKMTCLILTVLAIYGYLDSVSKFATLLNLHIIALALLLLVVTLLGYSVYLYKMMTDSSSDATLLNYLYMVMAVKNQVRCCILFCCIILEAFSLMNNNSYIFLRNGKMFFTIDGTWTVATIACITLLKDRSPESYLEMSQKGFVLKTVVGIQSFLAFSVFFFASMKCGIVEIECRAEHYLKVMLPVAIAAMLILLKLGGRRVAGEMSKIVTKMRGMIRLTNDVTPEVDAGHIGINVQSSKSHGINFDDLNQVSKPNQQQCSYS